MSASPATMPVVPPPAVPATSENSAITPRLTVKALFVITGVTDPGLLPRIIEPLAKLGQVPARVHATRESGDGSEMTVDLRLAGVPATTAERIEFALRAIVGVHQVFAVIEPAE